VASRRDGDRLSVKTHSRRERTARGNAIRFEIAVANVRTKIELCARKRCLRPRRKVSQQCIIRGNQPRAADGLQF
jgi:hypothetical protein